MDKSKLTIAVGFGAAILGALALAPPTGARKAQEPACLHGANETQEQLARRREAIAFTRHVNSVQANIKGYSSQSELPLQVSIPEGFEFRLVSDGKGYAFSVVDQTDPCKFAFFSNEAGLIYKGEAIR